MTESGYFATAPRHLESLLAEELRALGLTGVAETRGGARFAGSLEAAYRACLWSRVANRILWPLAEFVAADTEALYAGARELPWEDHLARDGRFAVALDAVESRIDHSHFAKLRIKDAIVDRFRARTGARPDIDIERPDVRVHAYLRQDRVVLSLDLSGTSLHRRGYRLQGQAAPLKENLAAAILLRAGWPQQAQAGATLLDPLCGSGTLCIEGALIAADIAPGLARSYWGLTGWLGHDPKLWTTLQGEARARRAAGLARLGPIRGQDRDPAAIRAARGNLERAGLAGRVELCCRELGDCAPASPDESGLVVANPPYGVRLEAERDLAALYARLGQVLREHFRGWRAALFTGNPELGRHLGVRAQRYHSLYNGPIACRLLHFAIEEEAFFSSRPRSLPATERGPGAVMFANRLRKNAKRLEKWRRREQIDNYRLYDADLPEYALAVDVYANNRAERLVQAQEYAAPASIDPRQARRRLREALGVLQEVLEVPEERCFFKLRQPQKGRAQYERLDTRERFHQVRENGLTFLVNFEDYLDTGLFLDHREIRRRIGQLAAGHHFLNLFAYTGTASVYAARGGARSTTSLDLSRPYLDWARRNLALNGLAAPDHQLVQTDCLRWLERAARETRRWGLIFLNPPSFSTSKRMAGTLDIQRDHVALIRAAAQLLERGGLLLFSTNLRRFRLDQAALDDLEILDLGAATLPRDFARTPRMHHCWQLQWRGAGQTASGLPRPREHGKHRTRGSI